MVKIYAARTLPVNPVDASLVLTRAQLWAALQRKVRRATEFVPAMRECLVEKDAGNFVVRKTTLEQHDGKLRHMTEEVTSVGQQWVSKAFSDLDVLLIYSADYLPSARGISDH